MARGRYVLAEYGNDPSDRWVVEDVGILELEPQEVADMNRAMVRSPCRVLPAKWFPAFDPEKALTTCEKCGRF